VRRIVLTGAPGVGKTRLLAALHARGHGVVDHSARAIIQERRARGLSPRPPAPEFARQILLLDISGYARPPGPGLVFFDRSIVDALGMVDEASGLDARALADHLARYPYDRCVFVLPPWEAIYATDTERDQSFADAQRVHEAVTRWYRRCGYDLIEVPIGTVEERCAFVLRTVGGAAGFPSVPSAE